MILGREISMLARTRWSMCVVAVILAAIGVLFVYSAGNACADRTDLRYQKQMFWVALGLVCYFVFAVADYRRICRQAPWIYLVSLLLLVLVLVAGRKVYGGRRWLTLVGGIGIQPSEVAKLAVVVLLAWLLRRRGTMWTGTYRYVAFLLVLVAAPFLLILVEPDLGTASVLAPVTFVMMFVAGVRGRILTVLASIGIAGALLVLGVMLLPPKLGVSEQKHIAMLDRIGLESYQLDRVRSFIDPSRDPRGTGWNRIQSEIAIGSGRLFGKGFTKGTSNILGFLPRTVSPTDFIFSVVAEETGFVGAASVLLLYGLLLAGCLGVAASARDSLGRLVCVGVAMLLFTHVFVNVAMTAGLLPIVGLPLPLMSSGGSFTICLMSGLGMVQSVYLRRRIAKF